MAYICHSLLCLLSSLKLTFYQPALRQNVPMCDRKTDLLNRGDLAGDQVGCYTQPLHLPSGTTLVPPAQKSCCCTDSPGTCSNILRHERCESAIEKALCLRAPRYTWCHPVESTKDLAGQSSTHFVLPGNSCVELRMERSRVTSGLSVLQAQERGQSPPPLSEEG